MRADDAELELFRREVSCATLLERWPAGWRLDRRGSTRRALKYRRGVGEILIINYDGYGWWDPQRSAKGDVFDLMRHLDPSLNFGQVRKELRRLVGVAPAFPEGVAAVTLGHARSPGRRPVEASAAASRGIAAWSYLSEQRRIPASILTAAAETDIVRNGPFRSGWFAHHSADGAVSHVEIRCLDYKGSLRGGTKTLFRFGRVGEGVCRLAVTEAPIDALSLAAIDGRRIDTIYVATGGGIGPGSVSAALPS
jgi:hypothetical protein